MAAQPTPLEEAPPALANGRRVLLKREDSHELGAFKWRGALPSLELYRAEGADAVVTASTGSHAGADVDEAKDAARAHAERDGLPFFEDGAEPAQFDGYAAIARELVEQLGELPALTVVPVGNGALLIGVARGLDGQGALGVVSQGAPVMALSIEAGHPVECGPPATFADGMAVRVAVPLAVEELVKLGTPFVQVSERAIARAVGAFAAAGIRVEGSAGSALAALEVVDEPDGPVVLIVTGHNIDDELHRRAVEDPDSF
jgi:threonine dehydratase